MPVLKPTSPNQRWHTDIMYLWVEGGWYFFVGVLDGYSRYLVHGELLASMRADDVTLVVQRALEKVPGAKPDIVSDHGSQFTSKDFTPVSFISGRRTTTSDVRMRCFKKGRTNFKTQGREEGRLTCNTVVT